MTTTNKQTIAEQIAERFDNNGECFTDANSHDLRDVCDELGFREYDNDTTRYTFNDNSVITIQCNNWDLGYPNCFCWRGKGSEHNEDCPNR